jgi:hypothetical protein
MREHSHITRTHAWTRTHARPQVHIYDALGSYMLNLSLFAGDEAEPISIAGVDWCATPRSTAQSSAAPRPPRPDDSYPLFRYIRAAMTRAIRGDGARASV